MTPEEAAAALNGNQIGHEGSKKLFAEMKAAGIVAVFGGSDDCMEFRGAIYDELGAFDGATACLDEHGLLQNECPEADCPYFARAKEAGRTIDALWDQDGIAWTYKTDIPHVTFDIMEDGEVFCRGIVFRLSDAKRVKEQDRHA